MIPLFALCITNLVIAAPATGHPNTTILRPNHISCVDERDVARLAAINDEIDLRTTITGFIMTGRCAVMSNPAKVVYLAEKASANGSTYYCYRRIDYELEDLDLIEVVAPTTECNIGQFITTLQELIAERTGEFKVIGSGPFGATAICSEGGRVTLRFQDNKVFRTAHVLPGTLQQDILAEPEIASAFRSGCKGVDSIR